MLKVFGGSKLIAAGVIMLTLWLVTLGIFAVSLIASLDKFDDIWQKPDTVANFPTVIVMVLSFLAGMIPFTVGMNCIIAALARNRDKKSSFIKGKLLFLLKFGLIWTIFPFYSLRRLYTHGKLLNKKQKVAPISAALFVFFIFIPLWLLSYLSIVSVATYSKGSVLGYSPVIVAGTGSMYPTFPKGDGKTDQERAAQSVAMTVFTKYPSGLEVFGKRYFNHNLERGDIISFQNKQTDEISLKQLGVAKGFVKRLIGLPGDTLELRGGTVYLNGSPLKETYTASPQSTFAESFLNECTKVTVPEGKVFAMGDNRKGSGDSREFGFVDFHDINSVLTLDAQKGKWDKNWRDTSKDLDETSKIKVDKEKYLELLNEKRKDAGVTPLKYNSNLEVSAQKRGEMMIKFNDFSTEATKSGYTSQKAIINSGYTNPLSGESYTQGYFTSDELIDNLFAFPENQEFLLNKDYDDFGISEIQGEVNGCPTQVIVQHFGGYVPPTYTKEVVQSWQDSVVSLRQNQPGWEGLKNNADFYQNHKNDVDRINELIALRIAHNSAIASKMQANQWLTPAEQQMADQDKALDEEQEAIAIRLNNSH